MQYGAYRTYYLMGAGDNSADPLALKIPVWYLDGSRTVEGTGRESMGSL
jgi:hypothetical protein